MLDLGTGSGCIAIALAHRQKDAAVTAVDLSPAALAVARRNAEKHRVADRIQFLEGDLFVPVPPGETFDFIVSNPPYIRTAVIGELAAEVRDHDPRLALDGGPDGFAVIDRLIAGATDRLADGGHLLFEIGFDQEADARTRLERHGGYESPRTVHDLAEHPRVLVARRKS
ncbi:MAG: HemK/PrmC family methyltransferase [Gemmataceae bacterium]